MNLALKVCCCVSGEADPLDTHPPPFTWSQNQSLYRMEPKQQKPARGATPIDLRKCCLIMCASPTSLALVCTTKEKCYGALETCVQSPPGRSERGVSQATRGMSHKQARKVTNGMQAHLLPAIYADLHLCTQTAVTILEALSSTVHFPIRMEGWPPRGFLDPP